MTINATVQLSECAATVSSPQYIALPFEDRTLSARAIRDPIVRDQMSNSFATRNSKPSIRVSHFQLLPHVGSAIRRIRARGRLPVTWNWYRVCAQESREGAVISKGNFREGGAHSQRRWIEHAESGGITPARDAKGIDAACLYQRCWLGRWYPWSVRPLPRRAPRGRRADLHQPRADPYFAANHEVHLAQGRLQRALGLKTLEIPPDCRDRERAPRTFVCHGKVSGLQTAA